MTTAVRPTSLPPRVVAALREDALGAPIGAYVALSALGLDPYIHSVHRVLIRVGTWYPHNPRAREWGGEHTVEYVKHAPACQACGRQIESGQVAVTYRFRRRAWGMGRKLFIHENCPEEALQ